MNTNKLRFQLGALSVIAILALLLIVVSKNSHPKAGDKISKDAEQVVAKYLSAEEDAIGSDQSSPTSWLNTVKPITTDSWLKSLQPSDTTTSNVPAQYYIAHSRGYKVRADVSNCQWVLPPKNDLSSASLFCTLSDTVINSETGAEIPAADLPFGWTHIGDQPQHVVYLIKKNGGWLINNDVVSG